MSEYAVRRLLLLVPTLVLGSMALFFALRLLPPRDAVDLAVGEAAAQNPHAADQLRAELGIKGNLLRQYVDWAAGFITGRWGKSLHTRRPITGELIRRIPVSFELSFIGLLFTWLFSFPLGILSAVYQDRFPDYVLRTAAYALDAIPSFIVGILLLVYLAVYLNWAPPTTYTYLWDNPVRHVQIMILPTIVVGASTVGALIRFTRTFLLEVLRQDYMRTARAKGLRERTVLTRHALRNLALPLVTIAGAAVPTLLTSSVIIESLFSLPGMGRYLVTAAGNLDYPVVMTTTMLFGVIILVTQLITDLSYAWIDPRVSYTSGTRR
ncbi:MAG TPA: ABC transporter permease [Dehalococcoidia bacterium]|nr:ABC transporter permease [Dehalococcoidia bacterium]